MSSKYGDPAYIAWLRRSKKTNSVRNYQQYTRNISQWKTFLSKAPANVPRMPAAKKTTKSKNSGMKGIGAKYKAKKTAANYGITKAEEKAMMKLAEKMAEKQINKNIETQYSQAMFRMLGDDAVTASSGWTMRGLNWRAPEPDQPRKIYLNSAVIFNLGYLSQVGASVQPGYRQGQRINAKSLSFTVTATLPQLSADCSYHWRVVRRKNDAAGNLAYSVPTITNMDTIGLFKSATDGPLASSIQYPIGSDPSAISYPIPGHVSAMRQNTDQWTFVSGAHGYVNIKAQSLDPGPSDQKHTFDFCQKMYVPLDQEWDFVTKNGCDIKGGNYFFVMWREGAQDLVQASQWVSPAGGTVAEPKTVQHISVWMELAFKDG